MYVRMYVVRFQLIRMRKYTRNVLCQAEVNIHYQGCNIIDIPQGRVECLFYYIG